MTRLLEILAVCGMGFGTSLLLRMAVEEILDEVGLYAKVAAWDSGTAKGQQVDMIICSEDLVIHLDGFRGKIVPIQDITSKEEIRKKLIPAYNELIENLEKVNKKGV